DLDRDLMIGVDKSQQSPNTDLQIKHSEFLNSSGSQTVFASNLAIEPENAETITFGDGANRSLVIENSSGSSVKVEPVANADPTITSEFLILNIYNASGEIRTNPTVVSKGESVAVEVTRDTEMFSAGVATGADPDEQSEPFDNYEIRLREDGNFIDSTDKRLVGIGYNAADGIQQNSTTGDIEVTVPRSSLNDYTEVTDDLVAEFTLESDNPTTPDLVLRQNITTANQGGNFTFTINSSAIAPSEIGDPESASETTVRSASLRLYNASTLPEIPGFDDDLIITISANDQFKINPEAAADQPTASVTFDDQTVQNGSTSVNVASATFNGTESFNLVVHQATDSDGDGEIEADDEEIGTKIGESEALTPGTETNIPVSIDRTVDRNDTVSQLTQNQTLVAMLHTANTSDDNNLVHTAPITRDGTPVFDQADITVSPESSLNDPAAGDEINVSIQHSLSSASTRVGGRFMPRIYG
ncbi:MAG: hypothetical protein J07HQW1_00039, partial [Haloquadratum walsbyi J07HQW1]